MNGDIERFNATLVRHGETLAKHEVIMKSLATNEQRMTRLMEKMHEQNTSIQLLSQKVSDLSQTVSETHKKVDALESWQQNIEGSKQTLGWMSRNSKLIGGIITILVVGSLLLSRYGIELVK